MDYWEDRLTAEEYAKVEAAQKKFNALSKAKKKTRDPQHDLYDALVNAGMYSEEADEMVSLLVNG